MGPLLRLHQQQVYRIYTYILRVMQIVPKRASAIFYLCFDFCYLLRLFLLLALSFILPIFSAHCYVFIFLARHCFRSVAYVICVHLQKVLEFMKPIAKLP